MHRSKTSEGEAAEAGEEQHDEAEDQDDNGLRHAHQLEMMMKRAHLEYAPLEHLEGCHLKNDR